MDDSGTRPAEVRFHSDDSPLTGLATQYLDTLLRGERHTASRLILDAVEEGKSIREIYLHVFQPCQYEIGRLWETNQISVAEEHYVTAATQLIMSQLYPRIFSTQKTGRRLVATCVSGELHEIGVRMVADFFEMEGWDAYYLGANTPTKGILKTLKSREADILAISATITFNLEAMKEMIMEVRSTDMGKEVKILAGGRPFNLAEDLWQKVGADAYAPHAQSALSIAEQLLSKT
jgi:methanogenic corrinoid protein MtbC1